MGLDEETNMVENKLPDYDAPEEQDFVEADVVGEVKVVEPTPTPTTSNDFENDEF